MLGNRASIDLVTAESTVFIIVLTRHFSVFVIRRKLYRVWKNQSQFRRNVVRNVV